MTSENLKGLGIMLTFKSDDPCGKERERHGRTASYNVDSAVYVTMSKLVVSCTTVVASNILNCSSSVVLNHGD